MLGGTTVDFDAGAAARHGVRQDERRRRARRRHPATCARSRASSSTSAKQTMQAIVGARRCRRRRRRSRSTKGYPPMAPTDGQRAAARAVRPGEPRPRLRRRRRPSSPDRAGAADVSFVAGEVKMIIDGVGLMGHDDHTAKETADLSDAAVADEAHGGAAPPYRQEPAASLDSRTLTS